MTTKPLLTLETLEPERPFLTIDGKAYELAVLGDFGLVEQARLARLMAEATDIESANAAPLAGPLTRDQEILADRAIVLLDEAVGMIVRALPPEVLAQLSQPQKMAILQAFLPVVQAMAAPKRPEDHRSRSTSAGSRRPSRRPTASARG